MRGPGTCQFISSGKFQGTKGFERVCYSAEMTKFSSSCLRFQVIPHHTILLRLFSASSTITPPSCPQANILRFCLLQLAIHMPNIHPKPKDQCNTDEIDEEACLVGLSPVALRGLFLNVDGSITVGCCFYWLLVW